MDQISCIEHRIRATSSIGVSTLLSQLGTCHQCWSTSSSLTGGLDFPGFTIWLFLHQGFLQGSPLPTTFSFCSILFCSILFYSRLCLCTAGSSPPPESSNFHCPLLPLSIPLPCAPHCHLSNDVLVFQLILCPLSTTLCF